MKTRRGLIGRLLAAILAGTAIFIVVPAPAQAVCSGMSCNYLDPNNETCAPDGRNLESFRYYGSEQMLTGALLELRYSPRCWAGWARVTGGNCHNWIGGCGVALEASKPKGTLLGDYALTNATGGMWYTNMLNYGWWLRACFVRWDDTAPRGYTRLACTAWR